MSRKAHITIPSVEGQLGWPADMISSPEEEYPMDTAFSAMLKTALTSFIGRVILAVFTLVVVPFLPTFINFVNDVLGYNLTDTQVIAYAKTASLGIAGLVSVWLLNRGLFERAAVNAKVVYDTGKKVEASGVTLADARTEHPPGEFLEPALSGDGEEQSMGFKASQQDRHEKTGDPIAPPGVTQKRRR